MSGRGRFVAGYLAAIIFILIAARSNPDGFQQLIDNTGNPALKEKLIRFKDEGIERAVHLDSGEYNVEAIIQYAESLLGTPHKMGGSSAAGIDCSGLVMLAHARFNISLPHSSHEQARYGAIVYPDGELKRGDLVFFHDTYNTRNLVTHSGIYLGDSKFIHTSTSRGVVVTDMQVSDYWRSHYLFATRLVE